ncbi:MAG: osmoprotectant NAGGN system M42 family peptidase [Gammaproteobacteria bacterium]
MRPIEIDLDYMQEVLLDLLNIPSPAGFTDEAVRYTLKRLDELEIRTEITRRGAIRADLAGDRYSPDRAVVTHLDTIGAIVSHLKDNGRLALVPIGTWSSRFAEGARATVYGDQRSCRGTIMPIKASGHAYNLEIDSLPVSWDSVELRLDEECFTRADLQRLGLNVGDFVSIDAQPEITESGFINSRHLDDKGGVAVVLAVAKAVKEQEVRLPVDCHLLFTISEEVGSGASAVLHGDVAEMVTVDTGPVAPVQSGDEFGVTVCMKDSTGPFDYHLTHKILDICREYGIRHHRDVFRHYRCDSASAIEAGNDIRTALVCFGTDGTHGYERCHLRALSSLADLLALYIQSPPTSRRDKRGLGSPEGFTHLPVDPEPPSGE